MIKKLPESAIAGLADAFKKFDARKSEERFAMATKIVNIVTQDVYTQDLVTLLADTEEYDPGQVLQFHTVRPVKAYILDEGSTGKRSKIIKDVETLTGERVYVGVELDLDELASGRFGSLQDMRRLAGEALLSKRNKQLYDVLNYSITSTDNDSNYYTFASGAAVATKKAALDDAINYVFDNNNNGPQAILARYSAIDWIVDIGSDTATSTFFADMTKEEIMSKGWITTYRGIPVFYLRSYKDADGVHAVGNSDIHVISDGTVKFARKRPGLQSWDQINPQNYSWGIDFWEQYGTMVIESQKNARINIS